MRWRHREILSPPSEPVTEGAGAGEGADGGGIAPPMLLGTDRTDGAPVTLPPAVLARHAAMLGSTGSGKTVMAKALIEEVGLAGIPSLILDPQGDLARLAMGIDGASLVDQGGDLARRCARWRRWKCASGPLAFEGHPAVHRPLRDPPEHLDLEELITAWDMVATSFTSLTGYDLEKANGKQVKTFLYEVITNGHRFRLPLDGFPDLAGLVRDPHGTFTRLLHPEADATDEDAPDPPSWAAIMAEHGLPDFEQLLPTSTRGDLARRLAGFSTGVNQLLFANGVPMDIDTLREPSQEGKVPVNIVYLNTIQDEGQKHYFVQELGRELYDWMLDQSPKEGELQLLFFMDEVAPYLPPHPRNPPAKDVIKLIFKQARKYGVACVLATQNVSDVDYKILAQANTIFVGRFSQKQDIDKVRFLLNEAGSDNSMVDELPNLGPGQFQMVAPDVAPSPVPIQVRWLYTDHGAPLTEEQVEEVTGDALRAWAEARSRRRKRRRVPGQRAPMLRLQREAAVPDALDLVALPDADHDGSIGVEASSGGDSQQDRYEARIVGGFSVLKEGSDPLRVMQAMAGAATALALLIASGVLLFEDALRLPLLIPTILVTFVTLGLAVLDVVADDTKPLGARTDRATRWAQVGVLVWLWCLAFLGGFGAFVALLIEVCVVWGSVFLLLEGVHRFRLGRFSMEHGVNLINLLVGVKQMVRGSELEMMRASSREVHEGGRRVLDGLTFLWILALLGYASTEAGLDHVRMGISGMTWLQGPGVWIASLYFLALISDGWTRMVTQRRGKSIE